MSELLRQKFEKRFKEAAELGASIEAAYRDSNVVFTDGIYSVVLPVTSELREEVFRLREEGYKPNPDKISCDQIVKNGLYFDTFDIVLEDGQSLVDVSTETMEIDQECYHYLIRHEPSGVFIGSARLACRADLKTPSIEKSGQIELFEPFDIYKGEWEKLENSDDPEAMYESEPPKVYLAEQSKYCICKDRLPQDEKVSGMKLFEFMRAADVFMLGEKSKWVASMVSDLNTHFEDHGYVVERRGQPFELNPGVQFTTNLVDIEKSMERIRKEKPGTYYLIQEAQNRIGKMLKTEGFNPQLPLHQFWARHHHKEMAAYEHRIVPGKYNPVLEVLSSTRMCFTGAAEGIKSSSLGTIVSLYLESKKEERALAFS